MKIDRAFMRQPKGKKMPQMEAKVIKRQRTGNEHTQQQGAKNYPSTAVKHNKPERWKFYSVLAVILLISLIVYLPVLQNGFVWDDVFYIKNNPLIHNFDLQEFFSTYVLGNYHPVTILTFAAEYHFFGLNETGYHAVNLLLHLLNVILVCFAVFLLSDKPGVALIAALLFGIHPMHVESVAWAAELKDLLYTFFFLASYILYLSYLRSRHKSFYYFALLFFSIALLSKAMAASLAVVLILTDYFKGRKIDAKSLLEKAPFFVLAIVFGIVAILAQKSSGAIQDMSAFSFPQRLIFASYGFITYIWKLFLPFNLSAFYPYPIKPGANIPIQFYSYLILLIGLVASVLYSVRYTKKIFFGLGFFAVTIFLVLQLLPVGLAIIADRYSYIPSIGIFYLAGEGFYLLWGKRLKFLTIILLSAFTIFFSVRTFYRCGVWKNEITLWSDVISQDPTIPVAYFNRGNAFISEKKFAMAIDDYSKAIALNPNYAESYLNRASILRDNNRYDEALRDFNKAIELKPDFYQGYFNRGILYMNEKKFNLAFRDYTKAIALNPNETEAYIYRGDILKDNDRYDEALKDYNKAIGLKPNFYQGYFNRGNLYMNEKKIDLAIGDYSTAITLNPTYTEAYVNRGNVLRDNNRRDEALKDYNKAIELEPDFYKAYFNRGTLFMHNKKNKEALKDFNKAIELKPGYVEAYMHCGNVFFNEKRFEDAVQNYSKAIVIKADYAIAFYSRGLAEYYSGKKDAACLDMKHAASLGYKPATDALSLVCK